MTLRYKRPDMKNAISILNAAKRDMEFTLSLRISEESAATIIRNIYECFRKLGDSLLVSRGIESIDHIEPIKEILKLKVSTQRPIWLIENLRRLRININYYGYSPNPEEVRDAISIAKACFWPIHNKILEKLEK